MRDLEEDFTEYEEQPVESQRDHGLMIFDEYGPIPGCYRAYTPDDGES